MRDRLRQPRVLGPALVLVTFAIGALWFYVPHVTESHANVISTPSLVGYQTSKQVVVRRGQQACIAPVPLEPALRTVRMILQARGAQAAPLDVELRAPGYRGTGRMAGYQPGKPVNVETAVTPAPPRDVDGTLCLRNTGPRAVGLVGTDEALSTTVPATTLDGKPAGEVDPAITFLGGPPQSILSRAGTILGRASDFTGGFLPMWLLWPLTILLVLAAPLALAWALYVALDPEEAPGP
jgi:hypothetical protein